MKRIFKNGFFSFLFLSIFLTIVLTLMTRSIESAALYSRYYTWLVVAGVICFTLLLSLIIYYLLYLIVSVRRRRLGSRLNARMMLFFSGLAILPIIMLFMFSGVILVRGIDSWFDESLDKGFDDALTLAQSALEMRRLDALSITQFAGERIADLSYLDLAYQLEGIRYDINAFEITVFDPQGRMLATSSSEINKILPERPNNVILMAVSQGMDYVVLEPLLDGRLRVRVIIRVESGSPKIIQAFYEVPQRYTDLGLSTQDSVEKYKQYKALREPLKINLIALLSMVALLAIIIALGGSFFATRRLVNPIRRLSLATKSISEGNFSRQIKVKSKDEIGFLTESFNEMIAKLKLAHEMEQDSQKMLEEQRAYLASVLEKLSSGVLVIDRMGRIRTYNDAAVEILATTKSVLEHTSLISPRRIAFELEEFFNPLLELLESENQEENRLEISRYHNGAKQIFSIRVSEQKELLGLRGGHIIVFDDITQLINSERESAWGEVARRLAHEIKNPLTPIQLSAERMQLKLAKSLSPEDRQLVDKSTQTIITQVNAMKEMVNAFSQYARAPKLYLKQINVNTFVEEVLYLYEDYPAGVEIIFALESTPLIVLGDEIRLRQLLHNLVKNAVEACQQKEMGGGGMVTVETKLKDADTMQLIVHDTGCGIDEGMIKNMFEPYVSTKSKGTGLGLAVVKKIVEEHNGSITIHSGKEKQGTSVVIQLLLFKE